MNALLPMVLSTVAVAGPLQEPARVFPSGVELVALDLTVVDETGRPVRDLAPHEFLLEVDGRERRVATVEFVSVTGEGGEAPEPLPEPDFTTNEKARATRLVLIIVDTLNIGMAGGREVLSAAAGMLDRLTAADRVALLTIPSSGRREEFTTDHARVRAALAKVAGRGSFAGSMVSLVEAIACGGPEGRESPMDRERCDETIVRECGSIVAGDCAQILLRSLARSSRVRADIVDVPLPVEGGVRDYLGFEPQGKERDGKARKVRVKVARPRVVVRARPQASFAPAKSGRARKEALADALRAPTLATALPIRVATWTLGGPEAGKVRLLIGAEIGGGAEPQGLEVG